MTTEQLTTQEILKNRQNFINYIDEKHEAGLTDHMMRLYPQATRTIKFIQLTQSTDGFSELTDVQRGESIYMFWYVVNPKEEIIKNIETLNNMFSYGSGIFVIQAMEENGEIKFAPIVKPKYKGREVRNTQTPTKLLQKEYWELYTKICDEGVAPYDKKIKLSADVQIEAKPQHWAYIATGKSHCSLNLTFNVKDNKATVEFVLLNDLDKIRYKKMLKEMETIEKAIGITPLWDELKGKKSSKIYTEIEVNAQDKTTWEKAIVKQMKIAEKFRNVMPKYM